MAAAACAGNTDSMMRQPDGSASVGAGANATPVDSGGMPGTLGAGGGSGGSSPGSGGAAPPRDPFDVVTAGGAVDIYVDAADFTAVVRAEGDLRADVQRVSGAAPVDQELDDRTLVDRHHGRNSGQESRRSTRLAAAGKLDTAGVTGKWESAVIQAVANPVAGVTRALVIAGSDRRGTVYGIYELSQRIGVSPWYWWADVAPDTVDDHHRRWLGVQAGRADGQVPRHLHQRRGELHHLGGHEVDAGKKPGPETYKKVFELLLRLKANFLWPAMHPVSDEFNKYPENAANADAVRHRDGVVASRDDAAEQRQRMGPVGQALMVRRPTTTASTRTPSTTTGTPASKPTANTKTATPWACAANTTVAWWLPMRRTTADKVTLMEKIFADQRKILASRVNSDVTKVFQVFTPYKEVLPIYNAGLKVPDDVTILWAEDNHGYTAPATRTRPSACAREALASTITSRTGEIRPAISGSTRRP